MFCLAFDFGSQCRVQGSPPGKSERWKHSPSCGLGVHTFAHKSGPGPSPKVPVPWYQGPGPAPMGLVPWSRSHGPIVPVPWSRSHGPGPIVPVPWARSHGPTGPVPWSHGPSELMMKGPYTLFVESYATFFDVICYFKENVSIAKIDLVQ